MQVGVAESQPAGGFGALACAAVTAQAGLDSGAYSVPYVAGWACGDVELLRESMSTALSVARSVTLTKQTPADYRAGSAPLPNGGAGPAPSDPLATAALAR